MISKTACRRRRRFQSDWPCPSELVNNNQHGMPARASCVFELGILPSEMSGLSDPTCKRGPRMLVFA